jgi:hypothetical protein
MTMQDIALPPDNAGATFEPAIGSATEGLGEHLVRQGQLKSPEAFYKVRTEALSIVRRCKPFDAKPGQRTGLVVGYVQSGKTMSMVTVSSLARDNGCRIVVLLAGVTTNLLKQNAIRFRDTLREASGQESWIIINSAEGIKRTSDQNVLRQAVEEWRSGDVPPDDQRTIFIAVLKNHAHLDWLAGLFSKQSLGDIPALILDDEADQAGLNVGDSDDPSTTYVRIQKIRAALPNHTYLQYTATPQAPLLIGIDDMLSPEFAELVEPGEGYTGGMTFFPEKEAHPYVIDIPPGDQFKPGSAPSEVPDSLTGALATFFVASGVCRKLGTGPKVRSMLIHPSARNHDQAQFAKWTQRIMDRWKESLAADDDDRKDTLEELRQGYDELARTAKDLPAFDDIVPQIKISLGRCAVREVNSDDASDVDWGNMADHILVGGEKLNRGYTVEGLMVTYMPRDSGGWNADTIQQRARFFGYKGSYLALCRVYLHPEVHRAFGAYVVHERDIRRQLREHRGKPLREWKRAFFLDAKMRPTRSNVIAVDTLRLNKDKHWFIQRYPHVDDAAIRANTELVTKFVSGLTVRPGGKEFRDADIAETTLEHLLGGLLLGYRATLETSAWYAHLVSLSDERDRNPSAPVTVVLLGSESKPRERTPEAKKGAVPDPRGALRLDQGRSSKEGGKVGDKDLVGSGMCTLQIHWIQVKDALGNKVVMCPGLALYSVREHDAFGAS